MEVKWGHAGLNEVMGVTCGQSQAMVGEGSFF